MSEVPGSRFEGRLPAGKLPAALLRQALERIASPHPRLVVGPRPGEDAAVIECGERLLVVTTDPVTLATDRAGWYAVHVNANDIAVMGAQPLWFFAVVLMPEGCNRADVDRLLDEIADTCRERGITLAGGHTEITIGLEHPIVVGQMMGETTREGLVTKAGLQPGDRLLVTRGAAIEGTAILARERYARLEGRVNEGVLARAAGLLFDPGISVLTAVAAARTGGRIHAMHDPTEGGILSGLHEMASAAGVGLRVHADLIPVLPETRAVCDALGADPLFLIASGALLLAVPEEDAEGMLRALREAGLPCAAVAEARPRHDGILVERSALWQPLEPAPRDEVARLLEE